MHAVFIPIARLERCDAYFAVTFVVQLNDCYVLHYGRFYTFF